MICIMSLQAGHVSMSRTVVGHQVLEHGPGVNELVNPAPVSAPRYPALTQAEINTNMF